MIYNKLATRSVYSYEYQQKRIISSIIGIKSTIIKVDSIIIGDVLDLDDSPFHFVLPLN